MPKQVNVTINYEPDNEESQEEFESRLIDLCNSYGALIDIEYIL